MDIEEKTPLCYKISCRIHQNKLNGLSKGNKEEMIDLKNYLRKTLNPSQCRRVKQLQGQVSFLYEAYIGRKALRLLFTINDDTHKIFLMDIDERTRLFRNL